MSELYNFASGPIRADHTKDHMGLTTWADAPEGKIKKSDVTVAKNYNGYQNLDHILKI